MHIQLRIFKTRFPRYQRIRWDRRLLSLGPLHLHQITHDYPHRGGSSHRRLSGALRSSLLLGALLLCAAAFGWIVASL